MNWNVYVTLRDPGGEVRKELVGNSPENELAPIIEAAMRRAGQENGGVQVSREIEKGLTPVTSR
jgi:hypothetical protein